MVQRQLEKKDSFRKHLPTRLRLVRQQRGLTQKTLAERSGMSESDLSRLEAGKRSPSLDEAITLAGILDLPLQWFLTGQVRCGTESGALVMELRWFGAVDLLVPETQVPGAFRAVEQVLAYAISGAKPDPRILQALPAILAWNRWQPGLLEAYARVADVRAAARLAWLADIALTIDSDKGFPGGMVARQNLSEYVERIKRPEEPDNLGFSSSVPTVIFPPDWKRWRITYPADLDTFRQRAQHLHDLRSSQGPGRLLVEEA